MSSPTADIPPAVLEALRQETKRPAAYAIIIGAVVLAFIVVCLRFYTRFILMKNHGFEDLLVGFAMLTSIGVAGLQITELKYGAGIHAIFVDLPSTIKVLQLLFTSILTYLVCCACTKLSILVQYLRIFTDRRMRIVTWTAIAIMGAYTAFVILTTIFFCAPVSGFWDITNTKAKCFAKFPMFYTHAALNVATEIMIATIPLPSVYKLKMPMRQKRALLAIFAVGYLACFVSGLRIYFLMNMEHNQADQMWYSAEPAASSSIEINLGIMCASLATIRPLIVRFFPSFTSSSTTAASGSRSDSFPMSRGNMHSKSESSGIKITFTTQEDSTWYPTTPQTPSKKEEYSSESREELPKPTDYSKAADYV